MKLIGLMPVRSESWCLGLTARAALQWCDELVIGLHACTDESEDIATQIMEDSENDRVAVAYLPHGDWREMEHRQYLLDLARHEDATHIAIIDSDEILTGNLIPSARHLVANTPPGSILQLPGYNLRGSINRYHADGIWGNRWFSVAFADDPRLGWNGDRFHAREPQGVALQPYRPIQQGEGGVMHLWGTSERRLKAKHALYKLTERLRWPNKPVSEIDEMYSWAINGARNPAQLRQFGNPTSWTYSDAPASWWDPYGDLMRYLDVDAEPWQEQECVRLIKEHGPRIFQGLDLFGVA